MYAHMPIIRDILYGAANRGASLGNLCDELSISTEELNDSEKFLDFERSYKAWEKAVEFTEDQLLGLHLGETSNPSIMGLIGHLMQSSPDLEKAFQTVCEYGKVATDMFTYSIQKKDDQVLLSYEPSSQWMLISPNSARQAVEQAMAGTLHVFKVLSGKKIAPIFTRLTMAKPKSIEEYERVFQSPLEFNAPVAQLKFKASDLFQPVISYDKSLYVLFDKLLHEKSEALRHQLTFTDQVKKLITIEFKGQVPSVEVAASRMNMTGRSFQRRLQLEGKSYRTISSQLRKEFALRLLNTSNSKMEEIADVLGYSEASAFRRAFKTWTDAAPNKVRRAS